MRSLAGRQTETTSTLAALQQQKDELNRRIAGEHARMARLLYQQYVSGRQDQFKILLNHEDPNLSARQLRYYGYLARARSELLVDLRNDVGKLDGLAQATEAKQAELAQIRVEQDRQKQQLLVQQQEKKKLLDQLSQQIGKQRDELSQLQRNEKRLTQLIERLAKLPPPHRKKDSAEAASPHARDASVPAPPSGAFGKLKGKLSLPVHGELIGRFGTQREDSGASWRGLFIRAPAGEEVHAVAGGRVVFADWLRGFGNLIIVDHGGGYMSLYGNNDALFKHPGDDIGMGEAIASTGNSGGNAETGLYFELRFQSKPFDPLTWCRGG